MSITSFSLLKPEFKHFNLRMTSSCILSLKTVISSSNLKCTSPRRRFCHASSAFPPQQLQLHLQQLGGSLLPSVVVLESHFSSPKNNNRDIYHSSRLGTGFFIDPTLIVTSMHVVGRAAASYNSTAIPQPEEFPHDSILYKAYIARTTAFTREGVVLDTRPLAVSFAKDVAVLEVVQPAGGEAAAEPPRGCVVAESPADKDSILVAISRHPSLGLAMMLGNVRGGVGERSVRVKAPWPLEDELGWIEHGWLGLGISDPAPGRSAFTNTLATRIAGSPWFNLEGEVVGVSSWEAKDEADEFSVGFAAPALSISSVVDYAKTKGPHDPIVVDRWIGSQHVIVFED